MIGTALFPTIQMTNAQVYDAAGLTVAECEQMPRYLAGIEDFYATEAFDKLFNYFMDTGEMPYEVAKARTECPDEWILNQLA